MTTIIDDLQMEIGIKFDTLIPAEYKEAWIYYEGGYELAPFFGFAMKILIVDYLYLLIGSLNVKIY